MLWASLVCAVVAAWLWLVVRRCATRPTVMEDISFLGVFFYGPAAVLATVLALVFGVIGLIGLIAR